MSLQLDHINGDHHDNRIENLRFLCPNCHSQTATYAGKTNKNVKKPADKKKTLESKECECCHKLYTPKSVHQKYCSYDCLHKARGKASKRPNDEQLMADIESFNHNLSAIGRKYGVSSTAVKKWIKKMA